jgi:predicted nucleotidyltransferase
MNQKLIIENEILLSLLSEPGHGREISKKLGIPLTSVQRALLNLEGKNVLDSKVSGKNRIYAIKRNLVALKFVINAENYNFAKLIGRYPFLEPLLEEILKKCRSSAGLIALFGSFAKFSAKKDSDVDIFAETQDKNLKREIESINSRLSAKIGSFDAGSLLIKEIIKNHVLIRGAEQYYEKLGFLEGDGEKGKA